MNYNADVIDKAAWALSGALMLLGIVVLGIIEILAGEPYGASTVEVTNDAGEVVNTMEPAIDPVIRTGLVILGLVVLLLWGLYRMAEPAAEQEIETSEITAD
jgi:hypothetical protein